MIRYTIIPAALLAISACGQLEPICDQSKYDAEKAERIEGELCPRTARPWFSRSAGLSASNDRDRPALLPPQAYNGRDRVPVPEDARKEYDDFEERVSENPPYVEPGTPVEPITPRTKTLPTVPDYSDEPPASAPAASDGCTNRTDKARCRANKDRMAEREAERELRRERARQNQAARMMGGAD